MRPERLDLQGPVTDAELDPVTLADQRPALGHDRVVAGLRHISDLCWHRVTAPEATQERGGVPPTRTPDVLPPHAEPAGYMVTVPHTKSPVRPTSIERCARRRGSSWAAHTAVHGARRSKAMLRLSLFTRLRARDRQQSRSIWRHRHASVPRGSRAGPSRVLEIQMSTLTALELAAPRRVPGTTRDAAEIATRRHVGDQQFDPRVTAYRKNVVRIVVESRFPRFVAPLMAKNSASSASSPMAYARFGPWQWRCLAPALDELAL
jgi:hypothetical protein